MSESLAEQARRKGFTQDTHRIGTEAYPLTVRPDPGLPKDWVVIDRWLVLTKEHIIEIGEAVRSYVTERLTERLTDSHD